MADNVAVTAGSGTTIAADEVTDGTLGSCKVGYVKIMDGTIDGTTKAAVGANGLAVDVKAAVITSGTITTVSAVTAITNALPAGNNNIGDVDVVSSALPTGASTLAEQQTQTASLSVLDDWDETDRCKINPIVGQAGVAGGAGATGATVQRVVQANDAGKTLTSKGGSAASSGDNTLISAGTNRLKIHAFSLSTTSTTSVTCIFQSGASGTELWRVVLQAATSTNTGANLAVTPPAWLFATASATLLNLNLSSAQTVHWSCSYTDEV